MSNQRGQSSGRQRENQSPAESTPDASSSTSLPIDQAPTARFDAATASERTDEQPLDTPTIPTPRRYRTLTGAMTARQTAAPSSESRATDEPRATSGPQRSQALVPLLKGRERDRALATINARESTTTVIPGPRKYHAPALSVTPRRTGPRSAVAQFVVSMIVTAMLISALTLSTPLGLAASMGVNGPMLAASGAVPWIPTPTPTATPKPTSVPFRPPAGTNPGQQAVIDEIVNVFGSYSQGALAIAKCESGYDPNAWNSYPILNSHASGVFQILYPSTWNGTSYAASSPFNADANIRAAYQIFSRDGYSWREWQCKPY
jgi:hypothetical protein